MARNIAVGIFACTLLTGCAPNGPEYKQTGCEIEDPPLALIKMAKISEIGKLDTRTYYLQFQPKGLLVRFPPRYYAPDWEDVRVIMEYPAKDAASGYLKLIVREPLITHEQPIGIVERSCWEDVKAYIQRRIVSQGIKVNLQETFVTN